MSIVEQPSCQERNRLQELARKPCEPEAGRRALAILRLMDGYSVSDVARLLNAARSSVYRWVQTFRDGGIDALIATRRGRRQWTVTAQLCDALCELLESTPQSLGYLRSTWSSELMALALRDFYDLHIHASTVRRLLPRLNIVWRRARPTLNRRDPKKTEKLAAIYEALSQCDADTAVLYVDEADLDLLPRIGFGWRTRGRDCQTAVITPGQNEKYYVAGALHAGSGQLVWVEHPRKNTTLFIQLLDAIRRSYRRAKRIVLILDNYIIHKTAAVQIWLADNPKFELRFQPVYHPWVNQIERLWKTMHDTVTRNHQCAKLSDLRQHVARFLDVVQPFPGNAHGVADLGSAI